MENTNNMKSLATKYVYHDGSVLQSTWSEISPTLAKIFPDLQGRLLQQAGEFSYGSKEISVILLTDAEVITTKSRYDEGYYTQVFPTATSKEIYLGRVIRKKEYYTYFNSEGRENQGSKWAEDFEIIRAEVPPEFCNRTDISSLPKFPD